MNNEEGPGWYFDIGKQTENVKDAGADNPLELVGMAVASREDVAAGRSDYHFDMMFGEDIQREGIDSLTQNIATWVIDGTDSFSADGMSDSERAALEREIQQYFHNNYSGLELNDVTVQESDRQYENEVQMLLDLESNYAQHTTECFVGSQSALS